MGFFKKIFFSEDKKETKIIQEAKENISKGAKYECATTQNQIICNGCGQDIDTGKPRMIKNGGNILYFHKRCIKRMQSGQLPKPKFTNDI